MGNIRDLWQEGIDKLGGDDEAELDAQILLQELLGVDYSYLTLHPDEVVDAEKATQFRKWVRRSADKSEPIPYIVGKAPFRDLMLTVSPAVLIPRPETEQLVDLISSWANERSDVNIVDVGTGSGCLAISLARTLPKASVMAVDVSPNALRVARQNGAEFAPNVRFQQNYLLKNLDENWDIIVANLPYVSAAEWTQLTDGVKLHEPALALIGGANGLDLIENLLQQATTQLRPRGAIFLEIGWKQAKSVLQLAHQFFPQANSYVVQDYGKRDRFVIIDTT